MAAKSKQTTRLGMETLEGREMPATLILLDFDGVTTAEAQRIQAAMPPGGWTPGAESSFVDGFATLQTQYGGYSRYSFLDFNNDGKLTRADGDLAAQEVVARTRVRYDAYDVHVTRQDNTDQALAAMKNGHGGDVLLNVNAHPTNSGGQTVRDDNNARGDDVGHVDSSVGTARLLADNGWTGAGARDAFLNLLANAAAHEAGHTFGLRHVDLAASPGGGNSLMNPAVGVGVMTFPNTSYSVEGGGQQNAHAELLRILGPRNVVRFTNQSSPGSPVVVQNLDGRQEIFLVGTNGQLYHRNQVSPGFGGWGGWYSMGFSPRQITVGANADGRLEVFALAQDGSLWHCNQVVPNGGWGGWYSLGGSGIKQIALGTNADGRLEIFAIGSDNAAWHINQLTPNGGWGGWYSLGGYLKQIALGTNADGRMELFGIGGDNAAWHINQLTPNGGWGGWYSLGGYLKQIAVSANADGRMEVFGMGWDNAVWHVNQLSPNGGWGGWYSLGGVVKQFAIGTNSDGRMEVFAIGSDNGVYQQWQTAPNGGWSGWASMGSYATRLSVSRTSDRRLEIFAADDFGSLSHRWQVAPNSGWSGWESLGVL